MVDTRSNMQLTDLKYKPHGGKILRNLIDRSIGARFYPPLVSVNYQLLHLYQFQVPSHINNDQKKKTKIKMTKTPNAHNITTKPAQLISKKTTHFLVCYIYMDMNIQMITNHPRLSILIFLFLLTRIIGYLQIARTLTLTGNITRKACLMLIHSVYSLILLYIQRYTHTHLYIKYRQEILTYYFHYILYICLS